MILAPQNILRMAAFVAALSTGSQAAAAPATTTLSFEDRFQGVDVTLPDGTQKRYPNPKIWAFTFWPGTKWPDSYGDGTNWLNGNGECQTYVTPFLTAIKGTPIPPELRYDPFTIDQDGLHIKASLLTPSQQAAYQVGSPARRFGSGILLTRFSFTYGKIRMVAKLPSARGSWPALWLLPDSHTWPPELDIFEGMVWASHRQQIHIGVLTPKGESGNHLEWSDLKTDPSADFHEYGLDWTPDTLTFLFDGKVLYSEPTPDSMKQSMYLLVNLAVGGKWPYNELNVQPIDNMSTERLSAGSDLIQSDYPAEMIVKSITIHSPD